MVVRRRKLKDVGGIPSFLVASGIDIQGHTGVHLTLVCAVGMARSIYLSSTSACSAP